MSAILLPHVITGLGGNPDPWLIRNLCLRPYPGHARGCPNYGRRSTCPPAAPWFWLAFDPEQPVYAVVNEFDLAGHVERMKVRYPGWSDRQLYCCLYWQGAARRQLRERVRAFLAEHRGQGYRVTVVPEAGGVDVTRTLALAGVKLEWPPRRIARQVALVGVPRERKELRVS